MSRMLRWLALVGLPVLTWWLFQPALSGRFLAFDDDHNITLNERLGSLDGTTVRWAFTDSSHARRYLPLGWLTFSALVTAAGFDASVFHATSLGLHIVNGLLLAVLLAQLAGAAPRDRWLVAGIGIIVAWWGWHPLRVEAVAWSSALLYVAATTWMLLAAVLFLAGLVQSRRPLLWLAHLVYAVSLLTYGIWLGAPLALLAAGFVRLRLAGIESRAAWRRTLAAAWPAIFLSGAALAVNLLARGQAAGQWGGMVGNNFSAWAAAGLRTLATLGWFLLKMAWPLKLTPADDMWGTGGLPLAPLAGGLGVLAIAAVAGIMLARRHGAGPWLAVLAFVAVELPLAGLTERDYPLSDRYTYSGQLVVAAVLLCAWVRLRPAWRKIILGVLAVLTVAGGVRVRRQLSVWTDSDHLFRHLVAEARHEEIRQFFVDRWRGVRASAGEIDAVEDELRAGAPPAPSSRLTLLLGEARRVQAEAAVWGAENTVEANAHHQFARTAWDRGDRRMALAHLARAVDLAPHNWPAWSDYAAALWVANRPQETRRIAGLIPASGPADACRQRVLQVIGASGPGN